jgi:hypothetical protein
MISIAHWAAFGVAFTAEADSLSRRIRRDFPDNRLLRLVMAPFLPGGARGLLLVLSQIACIWIVYAVGMAYFARGGWYGDGFWERVGNALRAQDRQLSVVTALCLQLIIYCGINTALARWGQAVSELVKPAHARVVTFLVLMAAIVGPQILWVSKVIDIHFARYHYLQVLDPINTAIFLYNHSEMTSSVILWILLLFAVASVMFNLIAMMQGMSRVLSSRVRPRKPADIKPISG